jgi:nucleotide-binding universal stress UspA family protein
MFKNIVVPLDLSDHYSIKAMLPLILRSIKVFNATINLVYIIPDFGTKMIEDYLPKHWMKDQKNKYEAQLRKIISDYISDEYIVSGCYVGRGAIYDEIIQYSVDIKADLIVVSAVRPQFRDYMLGPNASKIVRHSGISVLVIRE